MKNNFESLRKNFDNQIKQTEKKLQNVHDLKKLLDNKILRLENAEKNWKLWRGVLKARME